MTNIDAFLSTIGWSEGTTTVVDSDDGYNVLVGGTLFDNGYVDHPRKEVWFQNLGIYSSAAGRYQIIEHNYDYYKKLLNLPDFGHNSQDAIAIQLITECGALNDIEAGNFQTAVMKCGSRWASFPNNSYGQHQNKLAALQDQYLSLGGTLNDTATA